MKLVEYSLGMLVYSEMYCSGLSPLKLPRCGELNLPPPQAQEGSGRKLKELAQV